LSYQVEMQQLFWVATAMSRLMRKNGRRHEAAGCEKPFIGTDFVWRQSAGAAKQFKREIFSEAGQTVGWDQAALVTRLCGAQQHGR